MDAVELAKCLDGPRACCIVAALFQPCLKKFNRHRMILPRHLLKAVDVKPPVEHLPCEPETPTSQVKTAMVLWLCACRIDLSEALQWLVAQIRREWR